MNNNLFRRNLSNLRNTFNQRYSKVIRRRQSLHRHGRDIFRFRRLFPILFQAPPIKIDSCTDYFWNAMVISASVTMPNIVRQGSDYLLLEIQENQAANMHAVTRSFIEPVSSTR